MATNIFVNLPVQDLDKSKAFFGALGYTFNAQFTNDNGACMEIDEHIYCMFLPEPFFARFTPKAITDAHQQTECTTCLSVETRERVDEWAETALVLGATENQVPDMQQGDTMYGRSLNDLDGHIWEILWMDPQVIQE